MEVRKCATLFDTYEAHAQNWLQDEKLQSDGREHYGCYEPLGTILGIMPWNFPYWQVMRFAIPTLIAGNTVLIKHAPNVFGCSKEIEKLFNASLPKGVFQNLIIDHQQSSQVISNDTVQGVSLTGSDRTGSEVMQIAAKHLKKVVLELGGSDPFIVFPDANLKKAAQHATTGRLLTSGQTCIAAKRIFIHEDIYDSFLVDLQESFSKKKIGPLVNEDAKNIALDLIKDAKEKGANVFSSDQSGEGAFVPPTILTDIDENMLVMKQEVFAPIACVFKFNSEEQVIDQANDTPYGLGAAIFTSNSEKAVRIARQIDCGNVFINSFTKSDAMVSFGGVKRSGIGRKNW